MQPSASVLIPTLAARRNELGRTVATFKAYSGVDLEVLTMEGQTCGGGWNELASRAQGDLLFFACDDTLPRCTWLLAGLEALKRHEIPYARFYKGLEPEHAEDRAVIGEHTYWTRLFLLPTALYDEVGPFLPLNWHLDFDYSRRLIAAGWPIVSCGDAFAFDHLDLPRAWWSPATDRHEHEIVQQAQRHGVRRDGLHAVPNL